jgi:hypothetical protein
MHLEGALIRRYVVYFNRRPTGCRKRERSDEREQSIRAIGQKELECSLQDYRELVPKQTIDWFVESKYESSIRPEIIAVFVREKDGEGLRSHTD